MTTILVRKFQESVRMGNHRRPTSCTSRSWLSPSSCWARCRRCGSFIRGTTSTSSTARICCAAAVPSSTRCCSTTPSCCPDICHSRRSSRPRPRWSRSFSFLLIESRAGTASTCCPPTDLPSQRGLGSTTCSIIREQYNWNFLLLLKLMYLVIKCSILMPYLSHFIRLHLSHVPYLRGVISG